MFVLKFNLCVPQDHWWLVARVVFFGIIAMPAIRQFYLYCTDDRVTNLGNQLITYFLITIVEVAICYKTSPVWEPLPFMNRIYGALWVMGYIGTALFMLITYRKPEATSSGTNKAVKIE